MPRLARIRIYPFKALDPADVSAVDLLPSGALKLDRAFALVDGEGKCVNGKRVPAVHGLRAAFSPDLLSMTLHAPARSDLGSLTVRLDGSRFSVLESGLGEYFDFPVSVRQNTTHGFPDDSAAPGPTLLSTATLEAVAGWYEGISVESLRLRFRANLEIDGVPAFWEDRLFAAHELEHVPFRIGSTQFWGTNPCQRCIVPTRDAFCGIQTAGFQQVFQERRKAALPDWAAVERFNHYYRLALNTRAEAGSIRVGDDVRC